MGSLSSCEAPTNTGSVRLPNQLNYSASATSVKVRLKVDLRASQFCIRVLCFRYFKRTELQETTPPVSSANLNSLIKGIRRFTENVPPIHAEPSCTATLRRVRAQLRAPWVVTHRWQNPCRSPNY